MRYLGDECTGIAQLVERQARPITIVQVTDKLSRRSLPDERDRPARCRALPGCVGANHACSIRVIRSMALDKHLPTFALRGEDLTPLRRDPIEAATAATLLAPSPLDRAAPLQTIEQRIERGRLESERAV